MIVYCLADFFNLQLWRKSDHPTYADIRSGLEDLVAKSLAALAEEGISATELNVRLYGGWYGESVAERVPLRELTAAVARDFPGRSGPRLRIDLAETPVWDRSLRMLRTLRSVPLKTPVAKVTAPASCVHGGACSIPQLSSWLKGSCPAVGCSVRLGELGNTSRQKMVDTLITADAMALMRGGEADVLIIAGDDDDLIPALLALTASELTGIRLRRSPNRNEYYDGILALQGLHTHNW